MRIKFTQGNWCEINQGTHDNGYRGQISFGLDIMFLILWKGLNPNLMG